MSDEDELFADIAMASHGVPVEEREGFGEKSDESGAENDFFDGFDRQESLAPNFDLAQDLGSQKVMFECFPMLEQASPCPEKPCLVGIAFNKEVKKNNGQVTKCYRVWYADETGPNLRMGNLYYRRWSSVKSTWSASVACCQKKSSLNIFFVIFAIFVDI